MLKQSLTFELWEVKKKITALKQDVVALFFLCNHFQMLFRDIRILSAEYPCSGRELDGKRSNYGIPTGPNLT